jgi:hypothetical protein
VTALSPLPCPAPACTLCSNIQQSLTFRQEAAQAKLILYGQAANARLAAGASGTTDLQVESVIKFDPFIANKKQVELPRYIPIADAKNPPHLLIFCDIFQNKLDPYRGLEVKSAAVIDYLKGAMALDPKDTGKALLYFARFLEHADKEIARDAFMEFAKANDLEIGRIANQLPADKLRGWLKDPQTPAERLGLYAFLLGSCGTDKDADLLKSMLANPNDRTLPAFDGILAGYLQLRPREGWDQLLTMLRDERQSFQVRFAVLRTLRFQHILKPEETRDPVLKGLRTLLPQADMADLAVEDLRRWQVWDLTPDILALYGKKQYDAPLVRRTIVRYALSCPKPEAVEFVKNLRQTDPALVRDVEELLLSEKVQ